MSKKDKYLIDYKKLYPGVDIPPEVLDVLKKSDRKMMYVELDLKSEHLPSGFRQKGISLFPLIHRHSFLRFCRG